MEFKTDREGGAERLRKDKKRDRERGGQREKRRERERVRKTVEAQRVVVRRCWHGSAV